MIYQRRRWHLSSEIIQCLETSIVGFLKIQTKIGTLDMLLNAGEFHNEMTKQSMELEMPVLGSSANTSLTGSKYNLDDIDPPVFGAADILIDGGTSKYKNEKGRSSTIIDFDNFETIRIRVC